VSAGNGAARLGSISMKKLRGSRPPRTRRFTQYRNLVQHSDPVEKSHASLDSPLRGSWRIAASAAMLERAAGFVKYFLPKRLTP
jgi:hypothetical protein